MSVKRWHPTAHLRVMVTNSGGHFRQWWEDETGAGEWRNIEQINQGMPGWDSPPGQISGVEGMSFPARRIASPIDPAVDKIVDR